MCYCNIIYAAAQHFTNNFLPKFLNKYKMTKKYIVGLRHYNAYFLVGEREHLNWFTDADYTDDLEKFKADPRPKILMIDCFYPGSDTLGLQGDYSWVDLVIAVTSECATGGTLRDTYCDIKTALNNQNIIFVVGAKTVNPPGPGQVDPTRDYSPLLCWINHVYDCNDYTPSLRPAQKPYQFDCLLGQNRPHRLYLFYKLIEDNLLDKNLVSMWRHGKHEYYNFTKAELDQQFNDIFKSDPIIGDLVQKHGIINFYRSPGLDELELPDLILPKDDPINYTPATPTSRYCKARPEVVLDMGMDIPVKIFDASWYSIVAETLYETVFITEKIGKRLMTKRIFVLFAGQGCLKYLRSQGFQTFDGIIDESYDSEPDHRRRFDMAWEQVKLLNTLDPVEVYQRADSILEHNYNLFPTMRNEHLKIRDFIAQWLP